MRLDEFDLILEDFVEDFGVEPLVAGVLSSSAEHTHGIQASNLEELEVDAKPVLSWVADLLEGGLQPEQSTVTLELENDVIWYFSHMRVGSEHDQIAYVVLQRPAHSVLLPLSLRRLTQIMELEFCLVERPPDMSALELAYIAARSRSTESLIEMIASCCAAEGAILWSYDFAKERYRSIAGFGPVGEEWVRPIGGVTRRDEGVHGIVSHVRPSTDLVIYSVSRPTARRPQGIDNWTAYAPQIFEESNWDACVSWPVGADGFLLGAVSVYGQTLEALMVDRNLRNACSMAAAELLRSIDAERDIELSEAVFEREVEKNRNGALAIELVHDYKDAFEQVANVLKVMRSDRMSEPERMQFDQAVEQLTFVKNVTASMSQLARGRASTGRCEVNRVVLENDHYLQALAKGANPDLRQLSLGVSAQAPKGFTFEVDVDELTILRSISNLVENAGIWTRGEDPVEISITVHPAVRSDQRHRYAGSPNIILEVADNGPGVAPENRSRVFERGWTDREAAGGSGLGLHIVAQAARKGRGSVSVRTRSGGGAIFAMVLPAYGYEV